MSFLPARCGTQKLWMTSAEVSSIWTGRPTGRRSSLASSATTRPSPSRYCTRNHHISPMTRTFIAADVGGRSRLAVRVNPQTSRPASTTAGTATPKTRIDRSPPNLLRQRSGPRQARNIAAMTSVVTTVPKANNAQATVRTGSAYGPIGSSTGGGQPNSASIISRLPSKGSARGRAPVGRSGSSPASCCLADTQGHCE